MDFIYNRFKPKLQPILLDNKDMYYLITKIKLSKQINNSHKLKRKNINFTKTSQIKQRIL